MKRSIGLWEFFGFGITSILGTILHFLYDWLGEAVWIAPFSGVNESTWEHMKLLFWPAFIYAIAEYYLIKDHENFWCIKLRGILLGLSVIPIIYYTYNGAIGKSPDWVNITIFFISAAVMYLYETRAFRSNKIRCANPKFAFSLLCLIAMLFIIFTYKTPNFGIFQDPISKTFGI